tara:strand:+ start:352 stop:573 length:222 start_codon:yes stop_codon:yes gene_type:complete
MDEIMAILVKSERYDLVTLLNNLLEKIDYESDTSEEEYEPPTNVREPREEYYSPSEEEDYEVNEDERGFCSLS